MIAFMGVFYIIRGTLCTQQLNHGRFTGLGRELLGLCAVLHSSVFRQ